MRSKIFDRDDLVVLLMTFFRKNRTKLSCSFVRAKNPCKEEFNFIKVSGERALSDR